MKDNKQDVENRSRSMEHSRYEVVMVPTAALRAHEKNPRAEVGDVTELAESIREHGIEVPLVAAPVEDGKAFLVLGGHRRMTAALSIGLAEVPVVVRADLSDERDQLAFMATENLQRSDLSEIEVSRLVQEMLDLGWTQAEVAKQTALGRERVRNSVKLGRLGEQTGQKVHRGQISLADALVIAEFADDEESTSELEKYVGTYSFDWATARARSRRETQQAIEAARKEIRKRKGRLVAEDADFVPLDELVASGQWSTDALDTIAEDEPGDDAWGAALVREHASCPGHSWRATADGPVPGCDQAADEHFQTLDGTDGTESENAAPAAAVPERSPFEEFTAEELRAMAIFRHEKIANALEVGTGLKEHMRATITAELVKAAMVESTYTDGGAAALRGFLGGVEPSEAAIERALGKLGLPALWLLSTAGRAAANRDALCEQSATGWWWKEQEHCSLTSLMRVLGVEPSEREQELRALHGNPWAAAVEGEVAA